MKVQPHLFQFLSKLEWKMCYGFAFLENVGEYRGIYPLQDFATTGSLPIAEHWEEEFRRVIRFLALRGGYRFIELEPKEDGRIIAHKPVCEQNIAYKNLLEMGASPDIPSALWTAADMVEKHKLSVDPEPLRQLLYEVMEDVKEEEAKADPGVLATKLAQMKEALSSVGIEIPEVN